MYIRFFSFRLISVLIIANRFYLTIKCHPKFVERINFQLFAKYKANIVIQIMRMYGIYSFHCRRRQMLGK